MAHGRKTGGRTKGTPNKITADVKSMVLGALNDAGGQAYLTKQAQENPNAFLALVGKVLPLQIKNPDGDDGFRIVVTTNVDRSLDA